MPPGAAPTVFDGLSLWLELPGLQPVVKHCAAEFGLHEHPAHLTLLYNLPPDPRGGDYREELHRLAQFLRGGGLEGEELALRPTHLTAGTSRLFNHGYADVCFEAEGALAALFREAMRVFDHQLHRESFAEAPHACLSYARDPTPFVDGTFERALLRAFPALLKSALIADEWNVALWSTKGMRGGTPVHAQALALAAVPLCCVHHIARHALALCDGMVHGEHTSLPPSRMARISFHRHHCGVVQVGPGGQTHWAAVATGTGQRGQRTDEGTDGGTDGADQRGLRLRWQLG